MQPLRHPAPHLNALTASEPYSDFIILEAFFGEQRDLAQSMGINARTSLALIVNRELVAIEVGGTSVDRVQALLDQAFLSSSFKPIMSDLFTSYGLGLFVTLNPCVLPILPFVILSALNVNRWGPVALSAGLLVAYTFVGGTLALGFAETVESVSETIVSRISAGLLIALGICFLCPSFMRPLQGFLGRFTTGAQQAANDVQGNTLREQFLIGLLLALAWVPCASPALIASTTAASLDVPFWHIYLRYLFFGLGAITFILILGLGARSA